MRERQLRRETLLGLPFGTLVNEVDKVLVRAAHLSVEVLGARDAHSASRIRRDYRIVVLVEEHLAAGCARQHTPWRHALDLHHESHVLLLVLAREQRVPHVELVEDASETPHVDGCCVGDSEDDLGGPVESGLDVGVDLFVLVAA